MQMLLSHNIILPKYLRMVKKKGSSSLPVHWEGGARATLKMIAPQKNFRAKPKQAGKKEGGWGEGIFARLLLSGGMAEGGFGGNSAMPERIKIAASPAACSVRSRSQQKSFLSLLEEIGARKSGKEKKAFLLAGERQRAAAGRLHWLGFSAKKVRISSKQYCQFTISAFWGEIASALRASAGAQSAPKPHFAGNCHAPRGEKEMAWFWIWKFVLASPKAKQSFADQSFFVR